MKHLIVLLSMLVGLLNAADGAARKALVCAETRGGLIVHVGCREGQETAGLRLNDRCVIHGLESNPEQVDSDQDGRGDVCDVS